MRKYPKIYNLGHAAIKDIFKESVTIEEKIDGSQFSFCKNNDELFCRSKGADIHLGAPEKMFTEAVDTIKELSPVLKEGYLYRAEYLKKPKHNTLVYNRIPKKHIIIFDIQTGLEEYMSYTDKAIEAARIGLECVPILYEGNVDSIKFFRDFLSRPSCLGGMIEGVVVKNYQRFTLDKEAMLGKFVSESFKEVHRSEWKSSHPSKNDIIFCLIQEYKTPARWQKAIIHLRERGLIEDSPKDIGLIIKEVQRDILDECKGEIQEKLFNSFWSMVSRGVVRDFPEWYKDELLKKSFERED